MGGGTIQTPYSANENRRNRKLIATLEGAQDGELLATTSLQPRRGEKPKENKKFSESVDTLVEVAFV